MTTSVPLPDREKVMQILGLLFEGLEVKLGGCLDQAAAQSAWFGMFIADTGVPVALCGADINLAASFGAAFSMLPTMAVKEAVGARQLSTVMIENVREIMNICTRLMMEGSSQHLRLEQVYCGKSLPAAAVALFAAPAVRREFQLRLPKYGGGVLSLLSS